MGPMAFAIELMAFATGSADSAESIHMPRRVGSVDADPTFR